MAMVPSQQFRAQLYLDIRLDVSHDLWPTTYQVDPVTLAIQSGRAAEDAMPGRSLYRGEMTMSGKVYVSQDDGRFDLSDARRYGEIITIFRKDVYADNAADRMPSIMQRAYDALSTFDPSQDYLALVGSPLYTAICSYVLGDRGINPVRMLRFDKLESAYYSVSIG